MCSKILDNKPNNEVPITDNTYISFSNYYEDTVKKEIKRKASLDSATIFHLEDSSNPGMVLLILEKRVYLFYFVKYNV